MRKLKTIKNNDKEQDIKLSISHEKLPNSDLQWTDKESKEIETRILRLRNDQIAALLYLVDIKFAKRDLEDVVLEIKKNKHDSSHLGILIAEADSKENLLWWVKYFIEANHNKN